MPRRPTKQRIGQYALTAVLSLLVLWLLWIVWNIAKKEEIARHAVRDTKAELATLDARKQVLENDMNELSTVRGQEATLRQAYGVARPGEEVIIVVPPQGATSTVEVSWWQKTLNWFGIW